MTQAAGLKDVSTETLKGSLLHAIVADLRDKETNIAFTNATPAPAAGLLQVDLTLEVRDAGNDKIRVSDSATPDKAGILEVQVDITGGTATGKQLLPEGNGAAAAVDASAIVRFVNGKATVNVAATSTGTVILGLTDSGTTGLTVTSTSTVTFS